MRQRDGLVEVGIAMRASLERATKADPPLSRGEWKALSAVLSLTAGFTRQGDRVSLAQAASVANLSPKETGRRLKKLAERKPPIIRYVAGRGRQVGGPGVVSYVALPLVDKGRDSAHLSSADKGRELDMKGAQRGASKGRDSTPLPEGLPSSSESEKGRDSTPLSQEQEAKGVAYGNYEHSEPKCEHADPMWDDCRVANIRKLAAMTREALGETA